VFAKNNKKIISNEGEVSSGTVSNVQINGKDGGIRFNTATPITTKEITL
jgi:F0F1-type ATP synthase epsilon subunit